MNQSQKHRNKVRMGSLLLMIFTAAILLFSLSQLLGQEVFQWIMNQKEYKTMMAETAALFAAFCLSGLFPQKKLRLILTALIFSVFLWAHRAFAAAAISGLYLVYILFLGRFLRLGLWNLQEADGASADFLTGASFLLVVYCLMSAIGIGSIPCLTAFVLISAVYLAVRGRFCMRRTGMEKVRVEKARREKTPMEKVRVEKARKEKPPMEKVRVEKARKEKTPMEKVRVGKARREKIPMEKVRVEKARKGRTPMKKVTVRNPSMERKTAGIQKVCFISFILTMIGIQAGRLNIAVDYDSLWYGVRSAFILDNSHGIYENLGTIGIVYTYSKGLEVLTLPLAQLPSYGFITSVNLWLSAGVIYLGYKIGRLYMKQEQAVFLAAVISAVPGIMNMAVTAKSDLMTLLVQEIMVYYLLLYVQAGAKSWRYLAYALSAFFLSWTLKPTAMVFSTAVFGMAFLYFLVKGLFPRFGKESRNWGGFGVLAFSFLALLGIWARTMVITGLPVTSVFSSILVKMGLELKYPFAVNSIPNSGNGLSYWEQASQFGNRLFSFLLKPVGLDMDHVILAWGGFVLVFLLFLWITCCFCGKNVDRGEKHQLSVFLNVIYLPFLAVNLISLAMLTQVDGNYFMLFYVLTAVWVIKGAARTEEKAVWRGAAGAFLGVMLFSVFVTGMTNWNWTLGFTPVSIEHKGYYDHREEARQAMTGKGNQQIWDILSKNPENRVVAIGTHPEVLEFPCNIQSYDDITGVWGNVALVKTMDSFVEFLKYAQTDYIYAQAGYMGKNDRSYELVRDLIQCGKLELVCMENGNLLALVNPEGGYSQKAEKALTEFEECYIKREADRTEAEER